MKTEKNSCDTDNKQLPTKKEKDSALCVTIRVTVLAGNEYVNVRIIMPYDADDEGYGRGLSDDVCVDLTR